MSPPSTSSSMRAQLSANTAAALAPILSVASSISNLLILQFLLGMVMGFPASHIPTLQDSVFGSKAFAIVGAFGGVKGILSVITGPSLGLYSDAVGRREALVASLFLSTLPSIWVAVFDQFWGYYVTDALVGVYSAAMSIVMACVSDTLQIFHEHEVLINSGDGLVRSREEVDEHGNKKILEGEVVVPVAATASASAENSNLSSPNPRSPHHSHHKNNNTSSSTTIIQGDTTTVSSSATAEELVKRTRAMSIAMAAMGLGMICGAGIGTVLHYQNAFRCAMLCGIVSVCLAHWPMRVFLDRLSVISQASPAERQQQNSNNNNTSAQQQTEEQKQSEDHDDFERNNSQHESTTTTNQNDENDHDQDHDTDDRHNLNGKKLEREGLNSAHKKQNNSNSTNDGENFYLNAIGRSVTRSSKTLKTFTGLRQLAGIVFCDSLVIQAMAILIPLYMKKYLSFTPADQTLMMVTLGLSSAVGLLLIVPFVTAKLKTMGMLRVALVADMICVSLYSLVKSKPIAQILPLFTLVGVAMFPCASSLASEVMFGTTSTSEGLAQGIVSAARMFAEGVSPLLLGALLSFFDGTAWPGMPFLLVGLQELIALWFTVKLEAFMNLPSAWRYEEPSASPSMVHH